jgi:5-hydroxyisourate hydrolase
MSPITTHVLDTARGRPAASMHVVLEQRDAQDQWQVVGRAETDGDGRVRTLMPDGASLLPGIYRLVFETRKYFDAHGLRTLYPYVTVVFEASPDEAHYHIPLLLTPFGYTTYRGS